MNKFIAGVLLFSLSMTAGAATCAVGDITKKKWHFYTNNGAALYCQITVAGNSKITGFCRGDNEFDKGTKIDINSGKLKISDACDVTGTIKLSETSLSELFGGTGFTIKIIKARMSKDKDSIQGLLSVSQPGFTRSTFSASLN